MAVRNSLVGAAVLIGVLVAAHGASAAGFYSDVPGAPIAGFERSTTTFKVWNSGHTAQYTIGCLNQSYNGTKPSGGSGLSLTIQPRNCSVNIGGVRSMTPEACASSWSVGLKTYNATTGSSVADLEDCDGLVLHLDYLNSCWVSFDWVGTVNGATMQDRAGTDTANATHTTATGMRLKWTNLPLGYHSNCSNIEAQGTGLVSADGYVPGVWVGP